jgi:hypothetical protein
MFIPRSVIHADRRLRFTVIAALSILTTTRVLALNTDTHRLINHNAFRKFECS